MSKAVKDRDGIAAQIEEFWVERSIWLDSLGATELDVMEDDNGFDYIISENESGTPGDDYQIDSIKITLPFTLQRSVISDLYV